MPDAGSSIERLLPRFDAQTAQHVLVDADPERTYEALWSANLTGSPLARGLSQAAMLPTRVAARLRHEPPPAPAQRTARLEDMLTEDSPWTLLAEDAGIEVVLGILWRPPAGGEKRDAEEFSDLAEPGLGGLVVVGHALRRRALVAEHRDANGHDRRCDAPALSTHLEVHRPVRRPRSTGGPADGQTEAESRRAGMTGAMS